MTGPERPRETLARLLKGSRAGRRYALRLGASMAVYGVTFLAADPFHAAYGAPAVRWTLALLLALSTLGAVWAIARYLVEEDDEYLRARQARAVLGATGLTLAVYTLWGYLAYFGLAGELPAYDIFPVFSACWLASSAVQRVLGR